PAAPRGALPPPAGGARGRAPPAGPEPEARRKKLAIVSTEWRMQSHGQHMGDRFLVGYPLRGAWHKPGLDVAALYVDQKPRGDLSRQRAEEFGCELYPTIAEALRCGGDKLAVDGGRRG